MTGSRLNRRSFCRSALIGTAALGLARGARAQPERPNVLLITTDDMGPQLGSYGDTRARTPNLDALAGEGARFENAYVTQASCSPSRSSIFTGLYPHQNGQIGLSHRGYSMHEGMATLPALLGQAGYRTGVIGKIHVAPASATPFDWNGRLTVQETREVPKVAEAAASFIRESSGRPFFLMVNYMDPHRPLLDQVEGVPADPLGPDDIEPFPFVPIDTPKVRQEVAAYYNCNTRADVGVGVLLETLKAAGAADNTLVMFIGDHGPPFTRGKTTCYEAGVRIPFIVRWPGHARAALVSPDLVSTVDILPTVAEACGFELPHPIAGRSLVPLLEGRRVEWRETLATEYTSHHQGGYFPRRAIRDARYKLIKNLLPDRPNPIKNVDGSAAWAESRDPTFEGTPAREAIDRHVAPPAEELYDLQQDPVEFVNLADDPAQADVLDRLRAQLQAWREETNDPLLDPQELTRLTKWHDDEEWKKEQQ
jgi:N-sulfoglucosamine sulfohydrolase